MLAAFDEKNMPSPEWASGIVVVFPLTSWSSASCSSGKPSFCAREEKTPMPLSLISDLMDPASRTAETRTFRESGMIYRIIQHLGENILEYRFRMGIQRMGQVQAEREALKDPVFVKALDGENRRGKVLTVADLPAACNGCSGWRRCEPLYLHR